MRIEDGTGKGYEAKVDAAHRVSINGKVQTHSEDATDRADSFNINSGLVTLTDASVQGVLYIKNNEDRDFHIQSIETKLGPSTGGVATDTCRVQVIKNPTTGTLISEATAGDVNSNRNFGSSLVFTADVFKGDASATVTDGTVHIESLLSPNSREIFNIDEVLTKGDSIAITFEAPDSNTSMKVMAAVHGHLSDPSE